MRPCGESPSVGMSTVRDSFSFSLPFRFARPLVAPLVPFLRGSSMGSSTSSFFVRLLRLELAVDGGGGRCWLSFAFGVLSVVGEPVGDLLVEAAGTERLPERRGSFGEGGGPIAATLAIAAEGEEDVGGRDGGRWGNSEQRCNN